MASRVRIDILLVQRGVFDTRARAQAAIKAGLVSVAGRQVSRASDLCDADAAIAAEAPHPYVSRGGVKLAAALDFFGLDPQGRHCLDVGASTGGFSDCLLARGAAHVVAVDTGRDQLHPSLRANPRVTALEATDIRTLGSLTPAPDLAVIDVSFISLTLVLPPVVALLARQADLVALIKPQFEVGRGAIGKRGIVRDATARQGAVDKVRAMVSQLGFQDCGVIDSPITGTDGNQELLIAARRH